MAISDNLRGALYMNVAMLTFTINDSCMKAATQTMPLFQAITLRGVLALVALLVIGAMMGGLRFMPGRHDAGLMALRSLAEVGGTLFFLGALMHMPLANLSAIMQSLPLAVTLAAALVLGDAVGWRRMLAIAIGFAGVLIIIRPGTAGFDLWSVMGLFAVGCVVVRDLATRQLSRAVPSVAVAIWAAVAMLVSGLVGMGPVGWQPVSGIEAVLIAGAAVNLIVGYMFVVMVMRVGDISYVAPFRYMALLWAIILGWLMFSNLPDGWTLLGAGIVVATGIFTFLRERQLARLGHP